MQRPGRLPRWRDVSQVRRADLYLRSSLFLLLWALPLFVWVTAAGRDGGADWVVLLLLVLACVAGTAVLRSIVTPHDAPHEPGADGQDGVPRSALGGLTVVLVVSVVVARTVDGAELLAILMPVVAATAAGGLRDRRVVAPLTVSFVVVPLLATGSVTIALVALAYGVFLVWTVRTSFWLYGLIAELDRARRARSALAVAEERLRFSRDVHDVLGRRLSTIAVQAELASTLARRGDERAAERMLEVREGAHEALREARELARGYRETDLDAELDGAASLLASAGIACDVTVDGVPEQWRQPAAWVVREAVTNVLRHSSATTVRITWDGSGLVVADDGGAVDGDSGTTGSGLDGLRERVAPLGATVVAGPGADGFVVRLLTDAGASDEERT